MAATVVLFIALIFLVAVVAVLFACYKSQQRAETGQDSEASVPNQAPTAAVIYSRWPYPTPGTSRSIQQHHHHRHSSKATPDTIISNLPVVKYDACSRHGQDKPQCVICCGDYEQDDTLTILPCLHMYHQDCIEAWLRRDHVCPICQADVVLAAGLSMGDWSVHTLESVNVMSGAAAAATSRPLNTDGRPQSAPAATAAAVGAVPAAASLAACDAHNAAAAAAAGRASGGEVDGTCSTDSTAACSTAPWVGSVAQMHRTAEAVAAATTATLSSTAQQTPSSQLAGQHQQQQQPLERQGGGLYRSLACTAAAAGSVSLQDAPASRGRDSNGSAAGACIACAAGAQQGSLPPGAVASAAAAPHVAVTMPSSYPAVSAL